MGTSNLYLAITVLALVMMGCANEPPVPFHAVSPWWVWTSDYTRIDIPDDHCTAVVLGSLAPPC